MSLAATFFSAITILGHPVEYYQYGTMYFYFLLTYTICSLISAHLFIPMYMDFGFTSTYEYMETRFHHSVRVMATLIYLINTIIYIGIAIYAPALALEAVTGLGKWASVWLTGSISIFYTSIGGLKAVVWTDSIQLVIMMSGFLGILIKGTVDHGTNTIFNTFRLGGRNVWDDFMIDPRYRHTFWSIVIGGICGVWGNTYCATQSMVQRMLACKNKSDMKYDSLTMTHLR